MAKIDETLIDRRVLERNLKKGLVAQSDYDKHLESLPDREGQSEVLRAALPTATERSSED